MVCAVDILGIYCRKKSKKKNVSCLAVVSMDDLAFVVSAWLERRSVRPAREPDTAHDPTPFPLGSWLGRIDLPSKQRGA